MRIHPVAELKCNSQSAWRSVTGAAGKRIWPFVFERPYRDCSAVRRELDWQGLRGGLRHFTLRSFQQIESGSACLGFAIDPESRAGQFRVEDRHAMER